MNSFMSTIRRAVDSFLVACESPSGPFYALIVHSIFLTVLVASGLSSVISFSALTLLFRFAATVAANWVRADKTKPISEGQNIRATLDIDGRRRMVDLTLPPEMLELFRRPDQNGGI